MDRKRILFIARWYPDRHDEMLGLFVQKHASAVSLYNDVTVLYVTSDKTLPKGKVEVIESDFEGIKELRIYFGKGAGALYNFIQYLNCYRTGLNKLFASGSSFDLVHVHILTRCAIPALWLKLTRHIPYVITEHWSRYLPYNVKRGAYRGFLRKLFTSLAVRESSAVTAVTRNLADAMKELGLRNRYLVIPNVADTGVFTPVTETESNRNLKKLVHVSCFDEPAKNIKGIIDTVVKLASEREDFTIDIVGTGVDFDEVFRYASSSGLVDQRIFFTGLLTGSELVKKMQNADVMVMFSNYENLPCTIVESICCGVPVISTDVGGIAEHVTGDKGILVPRGNKPALFRAIKNILDNKTEFKKLDISRYGSEKFSMEAVGSAFDRLYREVL